MRPCDWSCHDIGCHHGSGGFLDQVGDAFTSIAGSAVISIETYQVLNLLIFALGAPLLISVLWGRLVGLKAWWIVLFWLLTGAAVLPFTDEAYRWCVEAMIWLANVTPYSYMEANVLVFLVIQPLLVLIGIGAMILRRTSGRRRALCPTGPEPPAPRSVEGRV